MIGEPGHFRELRRYANQAMGVVEIVLLNL